MRREAVMRGRLYNVKQNKQDAGGESANC